MPGPERFEGAYPDVWDYLTALVYPDGGRRQSSTLLLCCEDGCVKACLNDRDQSRSLWVSGESLETALEALQRALESGTASWRLYQQSKPRGR